MKKLLIGSKILGLALVSALAVPAYADECKDVDLEVKNSKVVKIKALKLEYKFASDNTWRTEEFSDTEVGTGSTKQVASNQNLAGGEGNRMLSMKLHYKAWCGGKWSKTFIGAEDKTYDNTAGCARYRTYRYDLNSSDVCNLQ